MISFTIVRKIWITVHLVLMNYSYILSLFVNQYSKTLGSNLSYIKVPFEWLINFHYSLTKEICSRDKSENGFVEKKWLLIWGANIPTEKVLFANFFMQCVYTLLIENLVKVTSNQIKIKPVKIYATFRFFVVLKPTFMHLLWNG